MLASILQEVLELLESLFRTYKNIIDNIRQLTMSIKISCIAQYLKINDSGNHSSLTRTCSPCTLPNLKKDNID